MFSPKRDALTYSLAELKKMKDEGVLDEKTLAALREKAEKLMEKPVIAVTKRKLKAISGNPHDYMSMGIYWWPNPDTPTGLPYVRRDGIVNPETSDSNSFGGMLEQVEWCTLAAFYFDEDRYAERAVEALYTWYINPETYMTPHARYAQAIPGICDGRGVGLIDFSESFRVMNSVRLLEAIGKIPDEYVVAIEKWYTDFTDWMLTSEIGVDEDNAGNNHGTWFDVQILAAAVFTDRPALIKKICTTSYIRRFKPQIKCDGSQPHELARTIGLTYSLMNHFGFLTLSRIADKAGDGRYFARDDEATDALIKLAIDYLYPYVKNPDSFPYQQIKDYRPYDSAAARAYYVLKDRFPGTHCEERFVELTTPDMLFLTMPAK